MQRIDSTTLQTAEQLEDELSRPTAAATSALGSLPGDLIILGVGGKMGPTLARMAQRASEAAGVPRRVIGVSRFSSDEARQRLAHWGVETIACDLLNEEEVQRLPDAPLVVYMSGMKFGASSDPALTWAMNTYVPALVSRRYRGSRIVAFSSGNVYGNVSVESGGSRETDLPRPVGEYAMTVLGRERTFEYFSRRWQTPTAILRLNYATELRYGVLVDLAQKVFAEEPVDVTMGCVNVIWQQEANGMALAALAETAVPARILNIAGPEILRVRDVCHEFGRLFGKMPRLIGQESPDALLNNAAASYERLGQPTVTAAQMIRWTADWVLRGGPLLGKPTHFESRDGQF